MAKITKAIKKAAKVIRKEVTDIKRGVAVKKEKKQYGANLGAEAAVPVNRYQKKTAKKK